MVENCEGFGKACVFFVCSAEVGLIDFFEEGLVVFDGKPVISDYDVLDFKFIVYLLLTALVHLSKASNHKNILLDRWIQLSFKHTKWISWTYKSISILIIQLISN